MATQLQGMGPQIFQNSSVDNKTIEEKTVSRESIPISNPEKAVSQGWVGQLVNKACAYIKEIKAEHHKKEQKCMKAKAKTIISHFKNENPTIRESCEKVLSEDEISLLERINGQLEGNDPHLVDLQSVDYKSIKHLKGIYFGKTHLFKAKSEALVKLNKIEWSDDKWKLVLKSDQDKYALLRTDKGRSEIDRFHALFSRKGSDGSQNRWGELQDLLGFFRDEKKLHSESEKHHLFFHKNVWSNGTQDIDSKNYLDLLEDKKWISNKDLQLIKTFSDNETPLTHSQTDRLAEIKRDIFIPLYLAFGEESTDCIIEVLNPDEKSNFEKARENLTKNVDGIKKRDLQTIKDLFMKYTEKDKNGKSLYSKKLEAIETYTKLHKKEKDKLNQEEMKKFDKSFIQKDLKECRDVILSKTTEWQQRFDILGKLNEFKVTDDQLLFELLIKKEIIKEKDKKLIERYLKNTKNADSYEIINEKERKHLKKLADEIFEPIFIVLSSEKDQLELMRATKKAISSKKWFTAGEINVLAEAFQKRPQGMTLAQRLEEEIPTPLEPIVHPLIEGKATLISMFNLMPAICRYKAKEHWYSLNESDKEKEFLDFLMDKKIINSREKKLLNTVDSGEECYENLSKEDQVKLSEVTHSVLAPLYLVMDKKNVTILKEVMRPSEVREFEEIIKKIDINSSEMDISSSDIKTLKNFQDKYLGRKVDNESMLLRKKRALDTIQLLYPDQDLNEQMHRYAENPSVQNELKERESVYSRRDQELRKLDIYTDELWGYHLKIQGKNVWLVNFLVAKGVLSAKDKVLLKGFHDKKMLRGIHDSEADERRRLLHLSKDVMGPLYAALSGQDGGYSKEEIEKETNHIVKKNILSSAEFMAFRQGYKKYLVAPGAIDPQSVAEAEEVLEESLNPTADQCHDSTSETQSNMQIEQPEQESKLFKGVANARKQLRKVDPLQIKDRLNPAIPSENFSLDEEESLFSDEEELLFLGTAEEFEPWPILPDGIDPQSVVEAEEVLEESLNPTANQCHDSTSETQSNMQIEQPEQESKLFKGIANAREQLRKVDSSKIKDRSNPNAYNAILQGVEPPEASERETYISELQKALEFYCENR